MMLAQAAVVGFCLISSDGSFQITSDNDCPPPCLVRTSEEWFEAAYPGGKFALYETHEMREVREGYRCMILKPPAVSVLEGVLVNSL